MDSPEGELLSKQVIDTDEGPYFPDVISSFEEGEYSHVIDTLVDGYQNVRRDGIHYVRDKDMTEFLNDLLTWVSTGTPPLGLQDVFRKCGTKISKEQKTSLKQYFDNYYDLWVDICDSIATDTAKTESERDLSQEEKLYLAKINQKLAIALYVAEQEDVNSNSRRGMKMFVTTITAFLRTNKFDDASQYNALVNGAMAQAAQMRMFTELGGFILVPDYTNDDEMKETDLRGVDYVVVTKQGRILFIDAKGRYNYTQPEVFDRTFYQTRAQEIVLDKLGSLDHETLNDHPGISIALARRGVSAYELGFPTSPNYLNGGRVRRAFNDIFGRLLTATFTL